MDWDWMGLDFVRSKLVGEFGDGFFEAPDFVGGDFVVSQEGKQEAFAGVAEEALENVANFGAAGFVFANGGAVKEGAAFLAVNHIAFVFKDPDGG
jgi:hypothetical protein